MSLSILLCGSLGSRPMVVTTLCGTSCSAPCMHACEVCQDRLIDRLTVVICTGHIELCGLPTVICDDSQGKQV